MKNLFFVCLLLSLVDFAGASVSIDSVTPNTMSKVTIGENRDTAGTLLNAVLRFTNQSITDDALFDKLAPQTETFRLKGVKQNATIIVVPRTKLPQGMTLTRAFAPMPNIVMINLVTNSQTTSLGSMIFDITVLQ